MLLHRQGATEYLHPDERGEKQKKALEIIKTYPMEPLPCLCGGGEDIDILDLDRFGYQMNYKLCKRCGLMRADPYFTEEALNQFYSGPYRDLDDQLGGFDNCWKHEYGQAETLWNIWMPFTGQEVGNKICEIGCGAGGMLGYLKEKGSEVLGVDSGPITEYGRKKGVPIQEEWPLNDKFDTILLMQAFEHFRDPREAAWKIRSMLKDDGTVLVNVPGIFLIPFPYHFDIQRYFILTHPWFYTRDTLAATMFQAGLQINVGTENATAIFTKCEPQTPQVIDGLADDIVKFLTHQEEIFQLFKRYDPAIFYTMKNTDLGAGMYKRYTEKKIERIPGT